MHRPPCRLSTAPASSCSSSWFLFLSINAQCAKSTKANAKHYQRCRCARASPTSRGVGNEFTCKRKFLNAIVVCSIYATHDIPVVAKRGRLASSSPIPSPDFPEYLLEDLQQMLTLRVPFLAKQILANPSSAQWRSEKTDGELNRRRWVHGSGFAPDTTYSYWRDYSTVYVGGTKIRIGGEIAKILDAKHWTPSNTLGTDRCWRLDCGGGGDTADFLAGAASMSHQSHLLCH